jgi:hypothetical protein
MYRGVSLTKEGKEEKANVKIPAILLIIGADERNRTADLLITSEPLCLLSYIGMTKKWSG